MGSDILVYKYIIDVKQSVKAHNNNCHFLFSSPWSTIDEGTIVGIPHCRVNVVLESTDAPLVVGLQHHLVGDLQVLLDCLLKHPSGKMSCNFSDVNISGESCSSV